MTFNSTQCQTGIIQTNVNFKVPCCTDVYYITNIRRGVECDDTTNATILHKVYVYDRVWFFFAVQCVCSFIV